MIFPVQLQLGPKKWNHQGTFPVWTEQMLWWWRGAFSSPLAFQRRSYWMILVNPDISWHTSWRKVSDKSRYISNRVIFGTFPIFFCFQNIPKQLIVGSIGIHWHLDQASGYFLRVFFYDAGGCAAAPRRFRRNARCEHYNPWKTLSDAVECHMSYNTLCIYIYTYYIHKLS